MSTGHGSKCSAGSLELNGEYSGEDEQKKAHMHGTSRAAPARARKGRPKYVFTKPTKKS
jgi:hypothetical protein